MMRGTRLVGTTLLVAGILAAASPPAAALRVEVPPGIGGGAQSLDLNPEDAPPPGSCRLWYPNRKRVDQPHAEHPPGSVGPAPGPRREAAAARPLNQRVPCTRTGEWRTVRA